MTKDSQPTKPPEDDADIFGQPVLLDVYGGDETQQAILDHKKREANKAAFKKMGKPMPERFK